MSHAVTLIRGDGAAGEFAPLLQRVLAAAGASLTWTEFTAEAADSEERAALLESARSTGCLLEAWAPAPGERPRLLPAFVGLAQDLELDVSVHPCKSYAGVPGARSGVDLMVWSGLSEGPYARAELRSREPETPRLARELGDAAEVELDPEAGFSVLSCTRIGAERVVEGAFEFAREHGRARLRVGTREAGLQATDGLFLHTARNVAVRFPDVAFSDWPVGDLCRELVREPEEVDVVVVSPVWGGVLAEVGAGLVGGVSVAPWMCLGAGGVGVFGGAWPAAKKVAGRSEHGPWGVLLACVWMLRRVGQGSAAGRLEGAVAEVLGEGLGSGDWVGGGEAVLRGLEGA